MISVLFQMADQVELILQVRPPESLHHVAVILVLGRFEEVRRITVFFREGLRLSVIGLAISLPLCLVELHFLSCGSWLLHLIFEDRPSASGTSLDKLHLLHVENVIYTVEYLPGPSIVDLMNDCYYSEVCDDFVGLSGYDVIEVVKTVNGFDADISGEE
ncbi:hypothetical protein Tco_0407024 [Tanacetum coccineum]